MEFYIEDLPIVGFCRFPMKWQTYVKNLNYNELVEFCKNVDPSLIRAIIAHFDKINKLKLIVHILLKFYKLEILLPFILKSRNRTNVLISLIHTSKLDPYLIYRERFERSSYNRELHSILKKYRE